MASSPPDMRISCPVETNDRRTVMLAHGGGGRLSHELFERLIFPAFRNPMLEKRHDAATLSLSFKRLAFTTDSFVVRPLFFPGGDIGRLAVAGTANDLAMAGARPLYLSASFILEEGLSMDVLERVIESMRKTAIEAGVQIVTGDTKVVDKGKGDGIFINSSGIGEVLCPNPIEPASVCDGDAVLLNGDIGRHGISIMAVREGLEFESEIQSDCAPLCGVVEKLIQERIEIHCLRDLTRGGMASALNEISQSSAMQIEIDERSIPVSDAVRGACEILGLDPLYVANEGRFVAIVKAADATRALQIMREHPLGVNAQLIGRVRSASPALVSMRTRVGSNRVVDMLSGEQLPRIC